MQEEESSVLPNSVAVLPFGNLSPDPDNAYFAAGLHEEILNQLTKLRDLSVISRTSVLRYQDSDLSIPEIARELNVGTVMEGSVRYANERVRITMQLIDAETDEHLWSETYDREFADIFAIESDIAMNVANALQVEFSLEEQANIERVPTESPAAYDLYLRALSFGYFDLNRASTALTQAIGLDPNFSLAYARLASTYSIRLVQVFGTSAVEPEERANIEAEARRASEQALRLDPDLGAAYAPLAMIDTYYWRWSEAQQALERVIESAPNDPDPLLVYARPSAPGRGVGSCRPDNSPVVGSYWERPRL